MRVIAKYLTLVQAFPLASIRDDAHLDAAIAVMNRLTTGRSLSPGEDMHLQALADLIETYENVHVHIPPLSGVELVRYLMDDHGLQQKDMVPLFGTRSTISEVLAGKRPLAFAHIKRLSERFGLPVDAFMIGNVEWRRWPARHLGSLRRRRTAEWTVSCQPLLPQWFAPADDNGRGGRDARAPGRQFQLDPSPSLGMRVAPGR